MADSDKSKSAPLPWVVLSGILGVFAVSPRPAEPPAAATKPAEEKKAAPAAAPASPAKDPLKPIHDFYATHEGSWDPADVEEDIRRRAHGYETEFLIATVPDPIDSPFGSAFDSVVESLQRAVERKDGYILDRSWLPWELDKKAKPPAPGVVAEPSTLRESVPGVLLFRHGTDKAKKIDRAGLCVVFLVGETPIGGMHKRAFTRCLRMMARAGHPPEKPVRVVGPFFSGSQTSLMFGITDWWDASHNPLVSWAPFNPPYRFQIITGNATAVRKPDFFNLKPKASSVVPAQIAAAPPANGVRLASYREDHSPGLLPALEPGVEFSSTIVPTKLTVNALLYYLAQRDGTASTDAIAPDLSTLPGKVAILTESNTGFGKQFASMKAERLIVLRFPMHISRVKSASAEVFKRRDEQNGLKQGDLLVHSLTDDGGPSSEGIPSQGGSATSASNGQVLASILSTIAREQCRYVGVVCTDTKDKLFLIRIIREYCPDVHVFVTGSDVLLAHPDYRYQMRGVLVGSTYPLYPPNQRWVKPDSGERNLFPSVYAQGYYNAALLQLGLPQHLLEYTAPAFALGNLPADDLSRQRPPIWISMVAPSGALVPLQVFTRYDDTVDYVKAVPAAAQRADARDKGPVLPPPLEYPGAMLPIGVALFGYWCYLLWRVWVKPSPQFFWPSVRQAAGDFALPNVFYRNLILGSQAILALPVLAVVVTHARSNGWNYWGTVFTGAVALVEVLLLVALFQPLMRARQRRELLGFGQLHEYPLDRWLWRLMLIGSVAGVFAFAAVFLWRFWGHGDTTLRVLFFTRSVDLGTGLSPLTPLFFMCLTFTAYGYFQLKRIFLTDRYSVPTPYPEPRPDNADEHRWFDRVRKLDKGLNQEINHYHFLSRHGSGIAAVVLGIGMLGAGIWGQSLPTIEGKVWDALYFAGFVALFALTVMTLLHLFFLWGQTKKLLDSMALVPMMRAFASFPAKVSAVFGKYLYTQRPHLSHLQVPAHQLRLLVEAASADPEAPADLKGLGPVADEVELKLRDNLMAGKNALQPHKVAWELRKAFSGVASRCLRALSPRWKLLPVDEAFGGEPDKDAKPDPNEPKWVALAEAFVATQSVIYVSQFFVQLRNLVMAVMTCSTLVLLAATSYPFHPERLLLMCLLGLIGTGVAAVIYVLIQMNKDEVVSRMSRTTPGRLSLDGGFLGSFLTYVVPALGILAAQLSGSFRWLAEPILRAMK